MLLPENHGARSPNSFGAPLPQSKEAVLDGASVELMSQSLEDGTLKPVEEHHFSLLFWVPNIKRYKKVTRKTPKTDHKTLQTVSAFFLFQNGSEARNGA